MKRYGRPARIGDQQARPILTMISGIIHRPHLLGELDQHHLPELVLA